MKSTEYTIIFTIAINNANPAFLNIFESVERYI